LRDCASALSCPFLKLESRIKSGLTAPLGDVTNQTSKSDDSFKDFLFCISEFGKIIAIHYTKSIHKTSEVGLTILASMDKVLASVVVARSRYLWVPTSCVGN